jgi:hypothetical protein
VSDIDDLPPLDLSVLGRVSPERDAEDAAPTYFAPPPEPEPEAPSAPPPPPRRNARARTTATKPTTSRRPLESVSDEIPQQYHPGVLVKPLRELYTTAGTLILPFNKPVGTAFIQNAEPCAIALDNAAKVDKQIRRMLMMLVAGSTWGQIIAAHMPILLSIAVTAVPSVRESLHMVQSPSGDETINPVSRGG